MMTQIEMTTSREAEAAGSCCAKSPRVLLGGVAIDAITEQQAIDHVITALRAGRGGWVITPNLDHLRRVRTDSVFRQMLVEAELVVADGMPVIWASRVQGTPLPERVAGSSMVSTLSEAAAKAGKTLYLLGGSPGAADQAAKILTERYPGLQIVGRCCPPLGFEKDARQMEALRAALVSAQPDIVYVALGSPKQELLIRQLRQHLPHTWWLGIGISLSFLCGQVKRAPRWMQRLGLEWFHRLIQEPRRLFRRYILEGIPFLVYLLGAAAWGRVRGNIREQKVQA